MSGGALATIAVRLALSGAPVAPAALGFAASALSFAAVVALFAANPQQTGFGGGTALGLARSARLVIAGLVLLGTVVPVAMYLMGQTFLLVPAVAVIEAASAAGQPAGVLLALVFALQFLLARDGRRLVRVALPEETAAGQLLGWALGLAPVLIAIAIGVSTAKTRTAAAVEHSRTESAAFFAKNSADSLRRLREGQELPRQLLARLHACRITGCVDSLILAAKRDGNVVRYATLTGGRYWASARVGSWQFAHRLVTDETGILYEWPILPPEMDHPAPDSTDILSVADTTVRQLAHLGDCVWYNYQLTDDPVPRHLVPVCSLRADTSRVRLASGAMFRVEYRYLPATPKKPRGDFDLSVRPEPYGREEARSFLVRDNGREIHVTTEDRPARLTDPRVHAVDFGSGTIRIATH